MGCGVLLVLNLPVIGVYWSALIQQQKYPQDDYTLPIWHNICLLLSPLLLLFSMLLFISRLKSKSRLNTVMFFVSPITMLVEGMMVAFSGDENISSSGTIYMIAEYCLPISDTNFFICQSMVFKFVFDILMKFTVEWSTLPNLTQCKGVTSFELLYYSINGLATGLGLALFGMSRDIPKAASKDMLEMITLISKIGSNVFYVMWATLRISAYLRLQFSIRDEPDEERGGGGEVGGEVVVRPRKNFLKGVNARILAFLRVEKGWSVFWTFPIAIYLAIGLSYSVLFLYYDQTSDSGLKTVFLHFWEDNFWPTLLFSCSIAIIYIGSERSSRLIFFTAISLPILELIIQTIVEILEPRSIKLIDNFKVSSLLLYLFFTVTSAIGLVPIVLAFARKSILFFFPPEIIHSHIVGLVPKILTAAVPPLVYLTFKSSTCIEVHYIVSDRTIEVSDEQCFGVQYSARPLQMLISGIAILRFFGIHYVFKDITAERIVTLKGVSKTDALQGTLFMISVTISVIMFGIGGEYEEDGTWALLGAYGFQTFFVIFILIEMGRMFFYKVGERENFSMGSSIRRVSSLDSQRQAVGIQGGA
ncbi:hypothetical protein TL16_g04758 [Triparma laevis f. inornata]|uniref:Uncharacterized protein n=1 Tax=Triparma laevis f. inornata TaxID=1714386 RepID=A0A9W7AEF5_9STRA|nr:hypothetical protein TL16_g04758 [Triparma laevis f. inornata]